MHFATSSLCPLLSYPLKSENFTNPRNRLHPAAILLQPCSRLGFRRPHGVLFFKSPKAIRFHTFFCPKRASTRNPVPTACQDDNKNRGPVGRVCARAHGYAFAHSWEHQWSAKEEIQSRQEKSVGCGLCLCVWEGWGGKNSCGGNFLWSVWGGKKSGNWSSDVALQVQLFLNKFPKKPDTN